MGPLMSRRDGRLRLWAGLNIAAALWLTLIGSPVADTATVALFRCVMRLRFCLRAATGYEQRERMGKNVCHCSRVPGRLAQVVPTESMPVGGCQ